VAVTSTQPHFEHTVLHKGHTVAHYQIDSLLGTGGMGEVYLADDVRHQRRVALKLLRPEVAYSLGSERFLREIEIASRLRHPHILPVYDSGDVEGVLFFVMPLVEGESLRARLNREKQLPLDHALRITHEVGDALSYAHAHGVVHRDIKPENILLESGHAVVADFGIARALSAAGTERLTGTGISLGTPTYMSPEHAAGDRNTDGRSDLYSLACVLFEMLAGEPPFTGPTPQSIIHQHYVSEPRSITHLRPAVPSGVAVAIGHALAKTPADRFDTVGQFTEALTRAQTAPAAVVSRSRSHAWLAVALGLHHLAAEDEREPLESEHPERTREDEEEAVAGLAPEAQEEQPSHRVAHRDRAGDEQQGDGPKVAHPASQTRP
jgi:eukaryotic-like serine/threonine-protein kinase